MASSSCWLVSSTTAVRSRFELGITLVHQRHPLQESRLEIECLQILLDHFQGGRPGQVEIGVELHLQGAQHFLQDGERPGTRPPSGGNELATVSAAATWSSSALVTAVVKQLADGQQVLFQVMAELQGVEEFVPDALDGLGAPLVARWVRPKISEKARAVTSGIRKILWLNFIDAFSGGLPQTRINRGREP